MDVLLDTKKSRPGWYKTKQNKKNATKSQRRALKELYPVWGIRMKYGEIFNTERVEKEFGRRAPCVLDIGFGTGSTLISMARAQPDVNFIGIDWHAPGVGKALLAIRESGLQNVRIICADAVTFLRLNVQLQPVFTTMNVFFPDPWSRARDTQQQQLRILRKDFVTLASHSLLKDGLLHIATDVSDYVSPSINLLKSALWTPHSTANSDGIIPRPSWRPVTIYEQKGLDAGRCVTDIIFIRPENPLPAEFTDSVIKQPNPISSDDDDSPGEDYELQF